MNNIKSIIYTAIFLSVIILAACKARLGAASDNEDGVVHGAKYGEAPKGMELPANMVYIPTGSFELGANQADPVSGGSGSRVSVNGFWMDKYEVTNAQYHQFINWVRDSLAALQLGYIHITQDGDTTIDWAKAMKINYKDSSIVEKLTNLMLPQEDLLSHQKPEINTKKLIYTVKDYDFDAAVRNPDQPRKNFIYTYSIPIYPDTLVWIRDFDYSYNISMVRDYFSNPAYAQYPVVGVSWRQATAYAHWRTQYLNQFLGRKKMAIENSFRLPTEAEWEYAARGGHNNYLYPWGNYLKNNKGCIMANFKDGKGNYTDDGALYPVRVDSYFPNDFGLYNMAGNVAEWTSTNYINGYQAYANDFNPDINIKTSATDAPDMKRKTIRGGSWKDAAIDIRVNSRNYEYADSARSYIGFRCVIDMPPRAGKK